MGVRELRTADEYHAAEALQRLIWGEDFELVPAHLIKVCQRLGGVGASAFAETGELIGFVFGITGLEAGALVHWSDILAVRPEARGQGLGRALKAHQREVVRAAGVPVIRWTFDPLVARNAHLNLTNLGARVDEYVPEMYAESRSPLNRGLGMDRLVVSWETSHVAKERALHESRTPADGDPDRIINLDQSGSPSSPILASESRRRSTRAAFLATLPAGYRVIGFRSSCYLLEKC